MARKYKYNKTKTSIFEQSFLGFFGMWFLIVAFYIGFIQIGTGEAEISEHMASAVSAVEIYEQEPKQLATTPSPEPVRTQITTTQSVTFRIAGDFMFARGVHKKFNKNPEWSLDNIGSQFFGNADASIVNLEGAIASSPLQKIAQSGTFRFIFPSTVIDVLKDYHINVVSLANNHSLNNGWDGFKATQQLLANKGIRYFGGPTGKYTPNVAIIKGEHLNLVMIGVHTLYESPDITKIIKKYSASSYNRVLVMPHWGVEYSLTHTAKQQSLARKWVNAGADLIVGAHPHVVQDVEVYKGVPIVYSLGNFLFDQTEKNTKEKGVQDGMTLHGKFTKDKLVLYGVPIRLENMQPQLIKDKEKEASVLKKFYKPWKNYSKDINGVEMFVF